MAPPICQSQNLLLLRVAPIALRKFIIPQERLEFYKFTYETPKHRSIESASKEQNFIIRV
jgi:hypothetical protein